MGSLRSLRREKVEEEKETLNFIVQPSLPPEGMIRMYLRDGKFYYLTSEGKEFASDDIVPNFGVL
jgi:hypothetical protein